MALKLFKIERMDTGSTVDTLHMFPTEQDARRLIKALQELSDKPPGSDCTLEFFDESKDKVKKKIVLVRGDDCPPELWE